MFANVVCWSVIAMLKEYLFPTLALSVLAVLTALKLHEKCCTTRKQEKDLEEEENQPDGQPLIEQPGSLRQEEIELKVKLESPTGKESNQCGRKELAAESKDNEHVSEHNKAR